MREVERIAAQCKEKAGVSYDSPFGEGSVCYRVGGKIFALLIPDGAPGALQLLKEDESIPREEVLPMAVLHCDPEQGDLYRQLFPKSVFRPYHSPRAQWPYAKTVLLNGSLPPDVLEEMVDHAYCCVFAKLTKKKQREITGNQA